MTARRVRCSLRHLPVASLLLAFMALATQYLHAEEDGALTEKVRADLLLFAGGRRYREPVPHYERNLDDPRRPVTTRGFGVAGLFRATEISPTSWFSYEVNAGLGALYGPPVDHDSSEGGSSNSSDNLVFLPGDRAYGGVRFCDSCTAVIGRDRSEGLYTDRLAGGHGAHTGVHLTFRSKDYGHLRVTPLFAPELTGTYLPGSNPIDSLALPTAGQRFARDARRANTTAGALGYGLEYNKRFDYVQLSAHYARQEFGRSRRASRYDLHDLDFLGTGLAFGNELFANHETFNGCDGWCWSTAIALERVAGRTATRLRNDENRFYERIGGHAGFFALALGYDVLRLDASFYIAEPETIKRGSRARIDRETSGYVGYGDAMQDGPLLFSILDARPFAEVCYDRSACEGVFSSRAEPGFRDQSASARVRLQYAHGPALFELSALRMVPLAPRSPGGNPFARTKRDPDATTYDEVAAALVYSAGSEAHLTVAYARLHRRTYVRLSDGHTRVLERELAAEVFQITFQKAFGGSE